MDKPISLTPKDERMTLREKAELHHLTVIERGRKVMDFVISAAIAIGMIYGEICEWQKLLRKK